MASSLRLPAGSLLSVARPGFHPANSAPASIAAKSCQCRSFSQTPITQRGMPGMPQNVSIRQPPQPSMKTKGREMSKADLPQDLGLLPGTFVRPLWRDLPSIFQLPRERLQMEWLWLKSWAQNFIGILAYCKYLNKGLPLDLKGRRQIGRDLHRQMYTAYAGGDIATLRKICCTGLANNLSARISNRPKDEKTTWSLDQYNHTPATFFTGVRILSDRATQIPDIPNSGSRQVVLRITSRQSTGNVKVHSTKKRAGTQNTTELEVENPATPTKQQDCTEYIVIQKLMWYGEEQEWRVWGHTTATTVEDLDHPLFAPGLSLADRLEAMKDMMGGRR